jgi:hypothetical protein
MKQARQERKYLMILFYVDSKKMECTEVESRTVHSGVGSGKW